MFPARVMPFGERKLQMFWSSFKGRGCNFIVQRLSSRETIRK